MSQDAERSRYGRILISQGYVRVGDAAHLKHHYGLTVDDVLRMIVEQNGNCALCEQDLDGAGKWAIDHKHGTKIVRGIQHYKCNTGLGKLGDSVHTLRKAISYLQTAYAKLGLDEDGNGKV